MKETKKVEREKVQRMVENALYNINSITIDMHILSVVGENSNSLLLKRKELTASLINELVDFINEVK